jgi:hypothetical protein
MPDLPILSQSRYWGGPGRNEVARPPFNYPASRTTDTSSSSHPSYRAIAVAVSLSPLSLLLFPLLYLGFFALKAITGRALSAGKSSHG